ncbi:uncharacterized protein [Mytilus edulis]|uniref:uncharacterized protein n=1 Tax=Mytilus edulis TaxID=6550 RepID=UPI0039F1478A
MCLMRNTHRVLKWRVLCFVWSLALVCAIIRFKTTQVDYRRPRSQNNNGIKDQIPMRKDINEIKAQMSIKRDSNDKKDQIPMRKNGNDKKDQIRQFTDINTGKDQIPGRSKELKSIYDMKLGSQNRNKNKVEAYGKVHKWCLQNLKNLTYTKYADKHMAKRHVNKVAPGLRTVAEYAFVTNSIDITKQIIDKLPYKYMFKPNHMSGALAIIQRNNVTKCSSPYGGCPSCKGINLLQCLRQICEHWLQTVYNVKYEQYYKDIPPMCMFEEYLSYNGTLTDYKIFTFYGKPYFIGVSGNLKGRYTFDYFTPKWNHIPLRELPIDIPNNRYINKPEFLEDMLQYATVLSKRFSMMRTDFFGFDDHLYFAEFSPTHRGCNGNFSPSAIDRFYDLVMENPSQNSDPEDVLKLINVEEEVDIEKALGKDV